ncbi:HTH-type transcriptional activator CmpR [uncultured Roseburia sp.]|uniref:LysR substrate-binding domain-containing protein n=1 Tax=Brotonthovivens ammoniilytica TaxID=2981725 RepID=A0ABT2TM37_9FIRM|nr:LysR family transcriptional regulator [Brotonthovivens ammoniilytica]MCU6763279.1 LysR substrate-binding domain-containing protein [Brotonthovivens ammoniilytica]SCJ11818.1 HTH-type transcriptional activator CmpR [uncultured Roseburia sp.]
MLDYRIDTFLTVCQEMNYTKAAQLLNITQPNVSQHIKWLEERYQQKLFEYQGRKLVLTAAGRLLKETAKAVCHEEIILKQQMETLQNQKREIFFGVTKSVNEGSMKRNITKFIRTYAGNKIRFVVDNTQKLLDDLSDMKLDFAIVEGNFDKSMYDYLVLSQEAFIPVCASGYQFQRPVKGIEDLFVEPLIVREEGSGSREIFENMLGARNAGIWSFSSVMEIGEIREIKELLKAGSGISFLYEMAVKDELEEGSLIHIPLTDLDIRHEFAMIWLKTKHFSDVYHGFAKELLE